MGNAAVKGFSQQGALGIEGVDVAEAVPQAE